MKKEKKQILKIAAVYTGAVIGAGLASGQELMIFFVRYGTRGLWGAAIAGMLFAFLGAMLLSRAKRLSCSSYEQYLENVFGKKLAAVFYWIVQAFLAVSFCVMLSGSGALLSEQFGLPPAAGVFLTAAVSFLVLQGNLKGLTVVNVLLVPLMLFGMILVCSAFLLGQTREAWLCFSIGDSRFLVSLLLYVSFNMLSGAAVLVPLSKTASSARSAAAGGFLGGVLLLLVVVLTSVTLYIAGHSVLGEQLPMLVLSRNLSRYASFFYATVLYMAMLTTAAANGFSVVEHFAQHGKSRRGTAAVFCLCSIPLSLIPFTRLVEASYTLFGILGFALLCGIAADWFCHNKSENRRF